MVTKKFMKNTWYPQPHNMKHSLAFIMEGSTGMSTIYPICMYDEGMGSASSKKTNPRNASFAESNAPNCYPESTVDRLKMQVTFSLTKAFINTDKLNILKFATMPIHMAFLEDYTAKDELSSGVIQDVVEMQTESTDRQGYPLYNGTKVLEKFTGSGTVASTVPGLTTNQILEEVDFDPELYYDNLQYKTTAAKLRNVQSGLQWHTLTSHNLHKTITIRGPSDVKRMNEYSFFGLLIFIPAAGTHYQPHVVAETQPLNYLHADIRARFLEWNESFDSDRV